LEKNKLWKGKLFVLYNADNTPWTCHTKPAEFHLIWQKGVPSYVMVAVSFQTRGEAMVEAFLGGWSIQSRGENRSRAEPHL
jgi:hypothetical protein